MATITKTVKENETGSSNAATWTFTVTGSNFTVSGSSFTFTTPTIKAKYSGSGKGYAWTTAELDNGFTVTGGNSFGSDLAWYTSPRDNYISWASGAEKTLTKSSSSFSVSTSSIFNANNKTQKTVNYARGFIFDIFGWSAKDKNGNSAENGAYAEFGGGALGTITLNAPPTFSDTGISFDKSYIYAGMTTASITLSGLSAKYGGTITEARLTIGEQSVTRTNNGALSILLNKAGTFTPTITVKDSRGQVTTKTFNPITVNSYTAPNVTVEAQRSLANGTPADEGTYGTITAKFNFTKAIANLTEPTIAIDGTTASVTWYSTRASDGKLSGSVDWASLLSPATVYGVISASDIQKSYQITVTPKDTISSGTSITQTLGSAFYTIDFLAGGHGIAFGQSSSEEGFFCNMNAYFKDKSNAMRALFDFVYPVGSYYETSDSSFDPNNAWGGTWVLEESGRVHVSAGTGYAIGSKGGSKDAIIPYHNHSVSASNGTITGGSHAHDIYYRTGTNIGSGSAGWWVLGSSKTHTGTNSTTNVASTHSHNLPAHNTNYAGSSGNATNANMQPYIVVNRWHRTA